MAVVQLNQDNIQDYIEAGLIDPEKIGINVGGTTTVNGRTDGDTKWIKLSDAIKGGYKFQFKRNVDKELKPSTRKVATTTEDFVITAPRVKEEAKTHKSASSKGVDMYSGRNQTKNDPGNISDWDALFGKSRKNLTVDKVYGYNSDGTPIHWTDTSLFKDLKWGNDVASDAVLTFVGGPEILEGVGAIKQLPKAGKALVQTGKYLANQWKLNPVWGAYETAKTVTPVITSVGTGLAGKEVLNKGLEAYNGQNWAQFASNLTGLPEKYAEYTNPFEWMGYHYGYKIPNNWWANVEKRGVEMAMKTTDSPNPTTPIRMTLNNAKKNLKNLPLNHEQNKLTRDRLFYLLFGKKGKIGYNNLAPLHPERVYNGVYSNVPSLKANPYYTIEEGKAGVIDKALGSSKELDPAIGKLDKDQSFGVHESYRGYNNKDIQVYELNVDKPPLNTDFVPSEQNILDGKNVLSQNSSIDLSNGTGFNSAGHLREYRINPTTGRIEYRDQDIWKFNPEDFERKWLLQTRDLRNWNKLSLKEKQEMLVPYRKEHPFIDAGLRLVDRTITPHIYRTPWFDANNAILINRSQLL